MYFNDFLLLTVPQVKGPYSLLSLAMGSNTSSLNKRKTKPSNSYIVSDQVGGTRLLTLTQYTESVANPNNFQTLSTVASTRHSSAINHTLSPELILEILKYLDPVDRAVFALTCKSAAIMVQMDTPRLAKDLIPQQRKQGGSRIYARQDLMLRLATWMPEDLELCTRCSRYRPVDPEFWEDRRMQMLSKGMMEPYYEWSDTPYFELCPDCNKETSHDLMATQGTIVDEVEMDMGGSVSVDQSSQVSKAASSLS